MGECLIMRRGDGGGGIPDGTTVFPANDYKTWIKCAGIRPAGLGLSDYSAVVNDAAAMAMLLNSQNAMEYLYRSFDIQMAVFGSATALNALDLSSPYVSPVMTSNTEPEGYVASASSVRNTTTAAYLVTNASPSWFGAAEVASAWIQIDLPYAVWPYRFQWAASANVASNISSQIQGSTDGSTWVGLTDWFNSVQTNMVILPDVHECTPNTGAAKMAHYRVQISASGGVGFLRAAHFKVCGKS